MTCNKIDLKRFNEGLICFAGGQFGILSENFQSNNVNQPDNLIDLFQDRI